LRNTNLQIATTVAVQEQKKMIYTQQEKFNYLAEKNPSLFELRKVLGLELDY
jgi:DNA polymerase III subunit gamma/tau